MAIDHITRINKLFQETFDRFSHTNHLLSRAWTHLEFTRESLEQLRLLHYMLIEKRDHEGGDTPHDPERPL